MSDNEQYTPVDVHGINNDYHLEIAKHKIKYHDGLAKFGENPNITTAQGFATVWDGEGTYVPPTQARLHDFVSTDALDTATLQSSGTTTNTDASDTVLEDSGATFVSDGVAVGDLVLNDTQHEYGVITAVDSETKVTIGEYMREAADFHRGAGNHNGDSYRIVTGLSTGAGVISAQGLGADKLSLKEFVILNGLTPVASTGSFLRINRMKAFGANSKGLTGNVTATAQTDGTVSAKIIDGNNQTLMAIYTVPLDKTMYLEDVFGAISNKQSAVASFRAKRGQLDGIGYVFHVSALHSTGNTKEEHEFLEPIVVGPGQDVWLEADTDTNGVSVSGGFDGVLVDETDD